LLHERRRGEWRGRLRGGDGGGQQRRDERRESTESHQPKFASVRTARQAIMFEALPALQ